MAVSRGVRTFVDNFDRAQAITTTPGHNGWTIDKEAAGGTPTYLNITEAGGALKLLLDNTSEAQGITLFQNDVLIYDVAQIKSIWWIAKVSAISAVTDVVFGVGSARNDTIDSVATNAWFKIDGSASQSNVLCQSDDATNDLSAASGDSLAAVYKKMLVDFTNGLSDVRYFMDGARVASGTTFDMSDLTDGLNVQPYVQLRKASGTTVDFVTIAQFGITYEWAYGA